MGKAMYQSAFSSFENCLNSVVVGSEAEHIFHKKNSCDLNLGESLCISTFFLFPDSGLNLLNDFDFLF